MDQQDSLRNRLTGTVKEIISDLAPRPVKVVSEVIVETAAGTVSAVITTRSVQALGLKVGDEVHALIKATNVSVERV